MTNLTCNPSDTASYALECLSMTYSEVENIASKNAGWRIPDIQDWENIIASILQMDTSKIRDQTFFTDGGPPFKQFLNYPDHFKRYSIWVAGKFTAKGGYILRQNLTMNNGGPNKDNVIIMGIPVEMDGKTFDPEAVLYLVRNIAP